MMVMAVVVLQGDDGIVLGGVWMQCGWSAATPSTVLGCHSLARLFFFFSYCRGEMMALTTSTLDQLERCSVCGEATRCYNVQRSARALDDGRFNGGVFFEAGLVRRWWCLLLFSCDGDMGAYPSMVRHGERLEPNVEGVVNGFTCLLMIHPVAESLVNKRHV